MFTQSMLNQLDKNVFPAKSVSYTATAGSTGTWPAGCRAVWLFSTTAAYVEVGEGVTATTASTPIPANIPILVKVPPGSGGAWRVSAVQVSAGGSVLAKPVNPE